MNSLTSQSDGGAHQDGAGKRCCGPTFHMSALFILLMLTMAAPFATVKEGVPLSGDGNPLRQISYIFVFGFVLWTYRAANRSAFTAVPISIALTMGWCWLSLSWAIEPGIALRRLMLTTIIIWTTFLAVRKAHYEETLVDVRYAMLIGLIANYIAVIAFPQFGIHHVLEAEGADPDLIGTWKGVLLQKNFAGALCGLTIIFYTFDRSRMSAITRWLVIAGAAFFLYKTRSKTSMAVLAASMTMGWLYLAYNPRFRIFLFVSSGVVALVSAMYVYTNLDALLAPFSGQNALTGRGSIWPVTIHYWRDHWLGSGYGSFWVIGDDSPVYRYGKGWVTKLGNGHNGYLDLLAEIGTPGLLLTVFSFVLWPLFKLLGSTTIIRERGALLLASLLFCAGNNMTESTLLDRDMIVQVFLTFTLAMITEAAKKKPCKVLAPPSWARTSANTLPSTSATGGTRSPQGSGLRRASAKPKYRLAPSETGPLF